MGEELQVTTEEKQLATVTDLEAKVNALVVSDQHSFEMGAEIVGIAKRMLARLEQARKGEVTPLNNQVSAINARFKVVTGRLEPIIRNIDEKMGAYQTRLKEAEELARREAEDRVLDAEPFAELGFHDCPDVVGLMVGGYRASSAGRDCVTDAAQR